MRRPFKLELMYKNRGWRYSASYASEGRAKKVGREAMERIPDIINWRVTDTRA